MQLVINTYGAYLRKKNDCFVVKIDEKEQDVSAKKVESILITTSAYISTDAIKLAVDNNIDIVFLDYYGDPYGRVWHSKLGSTTMIRRRQLEFYDNIEGLNFAIEWIGRKTENQADFLKKLAVTRPEEKVSLENYAKKINSFSDRLKKLNGTIDEKRQEILGLEGMSSKNYYEAISSIMPSKYKFDGRSRNPAKDEFNCLLNYGYGILYSIVEKGCIIAGLDPYIGFLHTDNYNKKSLVFDIIEMFRIHVDETVVYLFSKREVRDEYFDKIPEGLSLNKQGKEFFIKTLNERFDKEIMYNGRKVKVRNMIPMECHRIANSLIKNVDMGSL